jgi:hypothetical protein
MRVRCRFERWAPVDANVDAGDMARARPGIAGSHHAPEDGGDGDARRRGHVFAIIRREKRCRRVRWSRCSANSLASRQPQFDFYLAALANGSLKVKNPDGNGRYSDVYGVAPALGLTFRHRF